MRTTARTGALTTVLLALWVGSAALSPDAHAAPAKATVAAKAKKKPKAVKAGETSQDASSEGPSDAAPSATKSDTSDAASAAAPSAVAPPAAPTPVDATPGRSASRASELTCNYAKPKEVASSSSELAALLKRAPEAPKPEQVEALKTLRSVAKDFDVVGSRFRDTISDIVKVHYHDKRRAATFGLERELVAERAALAEARAQAIASLENFVKRYADDPADDDSTPLAMMRLAALHEERARTSDADLDKALAPAVALYKQIIHDYPKFSQLAGAYYYLGHALSDSARMDEAQQVWRSLVCHNVYAYPTKADATHPDRDVILPVRGDHSEDEWIAWRRRYDDVDRMTKKGERAAETFYEESFPESCVPIEQAGVPLHEYKYLAEIWWQIGNWEFDQLDKAAGVVTRMAEADLIGMPGVWSYNRAASAFSNAKAFASNKDVLGAVLYKHAWTLFKQQRYEASVRAFVDLLRFTDEREAQTGDPGSDFRAEAFQYIAGSLATADFKGPDVRDPFIPRPDIIDIETNPTKIEAALRTSVDRLRDPALIPQDRPWTAEIYKALANELRQINQFNLAISIYQDLIAKFPMHPDAPLVQQEIANTFDQQLLTMNRGTAQFDDILVKALDARTNLANYVGRTPWVAANRNNPLARRRAEELVRAGVRNAAVAHTNYARQALAESDNTGDPARKKEQLLKARSEFERAALAWQGYLAQDEGAPDAYDSRFWTADARFNLVVAAYKLYQLPGDEFPIPADELFDAARDACASSRDSYEDDKYLEAASTYLVTLVDLRRDAEYAKYDDSQGRAGFPMRTNLPTSETVREDGSKAVAFTADAIPCPIIDSIRAREEFAIRVPNERDKKHRGYDFEYYAGETFFLYGQFEESRVRFEPLWQAHCGKDDYGFKAWVKLITMSNLEHNLDASELLAKAEKEHSCAMNPEHVAQRDLIVNPTLQEASFERARAKFKAAEAATNEAEKLKLFREAAALYEIALQAAPDRDEAPEAAMNAAYAYKQVGEFARAISSYERFIAAYGNETKLGLLQKGDAKAKTAPDLKKYGERMRSLGDAYDALSTSYFGFFNFQRAAETLESIAKNGRFDEAKRRGAALNAVRLYGSLGQRAKGEEMRKLLTSLHPTVEDVAASEYLLASLEFNRWDPTLPDTGANRESRMAADRDLSQYYAAKGKVPASAEYALEAAYRIAKMKRESGDASFRKWYEVTIDAWKRFRAQSADKAGKAPFVDYAAEGEYFFLDEELAKNFDYEAGHHHYKGSSEDVKKTFEKELKDAVKYNERIAKLIETYTSPQWVPAFYARRGSIFDGLRTGLYNAVPPNVKLLAPKIEKLLKQLEDSGRDDLQEKADDLRAQVKEAWRSWKETNLTQADEGAVADYLRAVSFAKMFGVRNSGVQKAISRLAYLSVVIPDSSKLKSYVEKVTDPTDPEKKRTFTYEDGMFQRARSGLFALPPATGRDEARPGSAN
jgi:hypothetical protein